MKDLTQIFDFISRDQVDDLLKSIDNFNIIDICFNITDKSGSGHTLLTWASTSSAYNTVAALIKKGINLNQVNAYGKTALITAAQKDDNKIAQLLIENHIDCDIEDRDGHNAFYYMTEKSNCGPILAEYITNFQTVSYAIESILVITAQFIILAKNDELKKYGLDYVETLSTISVACINKLLSKHPYRSDLLNQAEQIKNFIFENITKDINYIIDTLWQESFRTYIKILFAEFNILPIVPVFTAMLDNKNLLFSKLSTISKVDDLLVMVEEYHQAKSSIHIPLQPSEKSQYQVMRPSASKAPITKDTEKVLDEVAEAIVDYKIMNKAIKSLTSLYKSYKPDSSE